MSPSTPCLPCRVCDLAVQIKALMVDRPTPSVLPILSPAELARYLFSEWPPTPPPPPPPHPEDNFSYAPAYLNHTMNLKCYVLSFVKSCAHTQILNTPVFFCRGGGGQVEGINSKQTSFHPVCDFFRFCQSFTSNFPFSFPFLFLSLSLSLRPFVCRLENTSSTKAPFLFLCICSSQWPWWWWWW